MKTVSMSGLPREGVGKKDARKHRADGKIPCVIYGGDKQTHFLVEEKDFGQIVFSPDTYFIQLTLEGKTFDCVLKDIQYHPVSDHILHADFFEFSQDKPLTLSIPIHYEGVAPGIIKGGQIVKKFRKLTVKALPKDMPDAITVDISNLDINDKFVVRQLPQEKYTILEQQERYIVAINPTRLSATETPGEGGETAPAK
jgi:large subunit ribosomal protein L25